MIRFLLPFLLIAAPALAEPPPFRDMTNNILAAPRTDPVIIAAVLYGVIYTLAGIILMRRAKKHGNAATKDARKAFLFTGLFVLGFVLATLLAPHLLPADPAPKLKCIGPAPDPCSDIVALNPETGEPLPPGGRKGPFLILFFVWGLLVPVAVLYPWLHLLVQKRWREGLAGLVLVPAAYLALIALLGL